MPTCCGGFEEYLRRLDFAWDQVPADLLSGSTRSFFRSFIPLQRKMGPRTFSMNLQLVVERFFHYPAGTRPFERLLIFPANDHESGITLH